MDKTITTDVLIIGAGLSGLTVAYHLKDKVNKLLIVDASDRIGGRIRTIKHNSKLPLEMGATWLGLKHVHLNRLLADLNILTFPQKIGTKAIYEAISTSPPYLATLPPNPEPTLRISGGSMKLISALTKVQEKEDIMLSTKIVKLEKKEGYLVALADGLKIIANKIISTIPPCLLVQSLKFEPNLPAQLIEVASQTHTWMADSIKIALSYAAPFWREENSSGTIISNVGPIPEMYDHSNYDDSAFALMGFLNSNYHAVTKQERLKLILKQLRKYYNSKVNNYIAYEETVWRNEPTIFYPYKSTILPHQNNGHELYANHYYDNNLVIAGTETSPQHPGYMEGAVYSGILASKTVLKENT